MLPDMTFFPQSHLANIAAAGTDPTVKSHPWLLMLFRISRRNCPIELVDSQLEADGVKSVADSEAGSHRLISVQLTGSNS